MIDLKTAREKAKYNSSCGPVILELCDEVERLQVELCASNFNRELFIDEISSITPQEERAVWSSGYDTQHIVNESRSGEDYQSEYVEMPEYAERKLEAFKKRFGGEK